MKVAFFTHCSDDWYEPVGCYKLEQSLRRTHPEIPFFRFGSSEIAEQRRLNPKLHWDIMIPVWGRLLADEFDLLVHFDADSIVTGRLDAVLQGDYEIAGVRNNDIFGAVRYDCPGVSAAVYLNCGLVAARSTQFWNEWHEANLVEAHQFRFAEQDVFNRIAHSTRYKLKTLDPPGHSAYYGVSAHPMYWQDVQLADGRLHLHNREVKVLHQAGGHVLPKLAIINQFEPQVARWLLMHTNSPCLRDSAGTYRGLGHESIVDAMFDRNDFIPEVIRSLDNGRLKSRLAQMETVIDVGAHMGIFSTFISPLARRVIACEASAEHQRALQQTISHLQLRNVEVCPSAVWTSSGDADLFINNENTTMHSLVKAPWHRSDSARVSCITLQDLLASHGVDEVSLLKMDIEGGELQVIEDQAFAEVAAVVKGLWIETHAIPALALTARNVSDRICRRLSSLGFDVDAFEHEVFASSK